MSLNLIIMLIKLLFYSWGILAIMYEMMVLSSPVKITTFNKNRKTKNSKDYTGWENAFVILILFYIIWCCIGLFTSQWLLFIVIICLGFIPKRNIAFLIWIDSLISLLILVFIFINSFHLHLNLWSDYVLPWIKSF